MIAGLYEKSLFSVVRNCQTLFQSVCPISYSHQQSVSVRIPLHPCQHLMLSVFQTLAILIVVRWYLIVQNFYSLMTSDAYLLFVIFGELSVQVFCPF